LNDPQKPHDPPCPPSFEQALLQLEQIVHQLEDGEIGLAEALTHYEQGVRLLKDCYGLLERAERRIELLSGVDADGNPVTEPFDDEASLALEQKAQSRTRRRSRKATGDPSGGESPASSATDDVDTSGSLF
jgi:exodeoxyribonuclease VII small subunit